MKYVLGVDAGNTKTIALLATTQGKIVGFGRGGCGDIYNTSSPKVALQNVDEAIQAATQFARCRDDEILSAAFSMAGADWPEDFSLIEMALKKRRYAKRIDVVNDAVGALRAGAVEDWGVAIANGTGAAISARSRQGKMWQTSWWQEGGGSRSLGVAALRAVYRAELGIERETGLTAGVLSLFGLQNVEELLHYFTRRLHPALGKEPLVGRLVLDLADHGDAVSYEIVRLEGSNLADYALAAARKVGMVGNEQETVPLVLAGSVFKHRCPLLINAIRDRMQSGCQGVTVHRSELEPSAGSVIIALESAGIKISAAVRACLQETSPPGSFFAT
jgi:N-acetylglucosamine kinase-like BadF-type ATPase